MINWIGNTARIECDDDQCFESVCINVGEDDDAFTELEHQHDWTVCFDPLNEDEVSVYCTRH